MRGATTGRVIGIGLLVAAMAATVAIARQPPLSDHVTFVAGTRVGADENGADSAKCPKGFRAGSGGFLNHVPVAEPDSGEHFPQPMVLVNSLRRPGPRTIKVGAHNIGDEEGFLYLESYCQRPAGSVPVMSARTRTASVAPNSSSSVTATCPQGSGVSFGGFKSEIGANENPLVVATGLKRISDQKWRVSGVNLGSTAGSLTAIAYCAKAPNPEPVTSTEKVPPNGSARVAVKCPPHSKLRFAGYEADRVAGGALFVWHFRRESLFKWHVVASNSGSTAGRLTAIAYCR